MTAPGMTPARFKALQVAAAHPTGVHRGNITDHPADGRRVYWQTFDWLCSVGYLDTPDAGDYRYAQRGVLSPAGRVAATTAGLTISDPNPTNQEPTMPTKSKPRTSAADALREANGDPDVVEPTFDQAALEAARPAGAWSGAVAASIDPALCDPDPGNPDGEARMVVDDELRDLADSLIARGMLEPAIVVDTGDGRYRIVAGHRRIAAAVLANLPEVPALLRPDLEPTGGARIAQLVENLHRRDLPPIAEARAYDELRRLGMKQADIGLAVGRNQGHVSKRLALLKLPEPIAARVGADLSAEDAVGLAKLPAAARDAAVDRISKGTAPAAAVNAARNEAERTSKRDALVARLEAKRVAVIDLPMSWGREEAQPIATGEDGHPQTMYAPRRVELTYDEHAGMPCHGAAVSTDSYLDPKVTWVCLDPAQHGVPSLEDLAAARDAEEAARLEAQEVERAARAAAAAARRDASAAAALAKIGKPEMVTAITRWTTDGLAVSEDLGLGDIVPTVDAVRELLLSWLELDSNLARITDVQADADPDADSRALALDACDVVTAAGSPTRAAWMRVLAEGHLAHEAARHSTVSAGYAHPLLALHFDLIATHAGYELDDLDRSLLELPPEPPLAALPDGDPPVEVDDVPIVAWYDPGAAGGEEGRWVGIDEARAIEDLGAVGTILWLEDRLAALEEEAAAGEPDGSADVDGDASPVDEPPADPGDEPAGGGPTEAELEAAPRWNGDPVVPGFGCPASGRRPASVPGSASGIPCPACSGPIDTTPKGQVRPHNVPAA